jgi:hypothetical protein
MTVTTLGFTLPIRRAQGEVATLIFGDDAPSNRRKLRRGILTGDAVHIPLLTDRLTGATPARPISFFRLGTSGDQPDGREVCQRPVHIAWRQIEA